MDEPMPSPAVAQGRSPRSSSTAGHTSQGFATVEPVTASTARRAPTTLSEPQKAVILAAGQGRRLMPHTEDRPKSAVAVAGRAILEWQLGQLARTGIREVVVVTGFAPETVESLLETDHGLHVRTLHNPFYAQTDNLGTCWAARSEMIEPFVLINGDTLFEAAVVDRLLGTRERTAITLATDHKLAYDADDMKVILRDGRITRVGKKLDLEQVNAESIGVMSFRGEGPSLFRRKLEALMRHAEGCNRWYLSAIDLLATDVAVGSCSIHGLAWSEVDDHADLARAHELVTDLEELPPTVSVRA